MQHVCRLEYPQLLHGSLSDKATICIMLIHHQKTTELCLKKQISAKIIITEAGSLSSPIVEVISRFHARIHI
jgi:hypothetical protein